MHTYTHMHIYIYIYRERERYKERERDVVAEYNATCACMYKDVRLFIDLERYSETDDCHYIDPLTLYFDSGPGADRLP